MKRLLVLLVLVFVVWASVRFLVPREAGAEPARVLARERAAVHFERGEFDQARAALGPLVERSDAALEDLERAATLEFAARTTEAEAALVRLAALDPANAVLHYLRARQRVALGEFTAAEEHFRAVLRTQPGDPATRVGLAATLSDLGRDAEALALLDEVLARGVEHGGAWYVWAVYRKLTLARRAGSPESAQALEELWRRLEALGYRVPHPDEIDRGTLARLRPPAPGGSAGAAEGAPPRFVAEAPILPEFAEARELHATDLDGDGAVDFLAAGPRGVEVALRTATGYAPEHVLDGPIELVRALDLGNRDVVDLLACRGTEIVLLEQRAGLELVLAAAGSARWARAPLEFPPLPAPPADVALVDFDHEGDLDLLLVGAFGARLWRNDGAAARVDALGNVTRGSFVDAGSAAALPPGDFRWCLVEDFDGDQDVDFLFGGPNGTHLASNLRAGSFEDVTARVFADAPRLSARPLVADLDADGRADLLAPGEPALLWRRRADGTFEAAAQRFTLAATPLATDLDLDGTLDLVWQDARGVASRLAFGLAVERELLLTTEERGQALLAVDLERDLDLDLVRSTARGLEFVRNSGPVGKAARLAPLGLKDNRRALGALVEARTGGLYRRIFWRGEPELLGCGANAALDVVRITWPNGVVQSRLAVAPADEPFLDTEAGALEQSDALIGSCPFLYAWNGRTFEFVTDVLGGTPLGLPMAPGMLVPPDHDEYVLVRGEQLVPRDGVLELALTEELREVTYLDRVRLDVVDHPAATEIHPNERFTFPPFPAPHVHSVSETLSPVRATGSDGRDWTAALAAIDDVHATPFEPLDAQFLGLATPHWIELEFEAERVRAAPRLRLLCTGWFFWTDASVNMAAARTPDVRFVPPTLQVPGPDGEWRDVGPSPGFPAGKSKTMVLELDGLLDREHPRLRIRSSLRLYWDALRLAIDADDAARRVTELEPLGAELWPRGFSRALAAERADLPERFEWDVLAADARWDQHPGLYTRYGETLPLVQAIDDRFVILGSGDALTLRFDARALPPLPAGWRRDYLVFLDGWAKDRDPNTLAALAVEPLPFHGMSGYPYGADERFPAAAEHEAWRREWNTRPARRWLVPLAPAREAEHAASLALRRE